MLADVLWHHVGLHIRILWWFPKAVEYTELEDFFFLLP